MTDSRLINLANILVNYSVEVKPGSWTVIRCGVLGLPLANAVYERVLAAGGNASVLLNNDDLGETLLRTANEDQLKWESPIDRLTIENMDNLIAIRAPENTRALSGIDPQKQQIHMKAGEPLSKLVFQRSAAGELNWVVTNYPCAAFAQEADMSLRDYEDFVYAATFADQDDPVMAWQKVHQEQERLIKWLDGKKQVTLRSPNIDLTLSIEGRTFVNADGRVNMPDGEIFTGPVEDSVNGWVRYSFPAVKYGHVVEDVEFTFKDGRVTQASAGKNEAFLLSMLDSDPGARILGEFAIGTNYQIQRFTGSILYDEKIGGTVHMAVGRGYPETGSKNESSIHWDFICDMRQDSEILVDGELFYKDGQFQV